MATNIGWKIRPAAQDDLSEIWRQGSAIWGADQADRYADTLFSLFDMLAEFPEMARERPEFAPPVRMHPSGAHVVIYCSEGQGVEIIRILHAHQNLSAYLQDG